MRRRRWQICVRTIRIISDGYEKIQVSRKKDHDEPDTIHPRATTRLVRQRGVLRSRSWAAARVARDQRPGWLCFWHAGRASDAQLSWLAGGRALSARRTHRPRRWHDRMGNLCWHALCPLDE